MSEEDDNQDASLGPPGLSLHSVLPVTGEEIVVETASATGTQAEADAADDLPEFVGRYRVASLLGKGGYGRVFKAYDDHLERHVAIKVPLVYRITDVASRQRYLDEARTLAKLEHSGIVTVHDVGVTDDGLPYIVSAFIDGSDLFLRMRSQPFTLNKGLRLIASIGRALEYIHSQGVVHRDIKPGNILLNRDETPFLADFGLALRDEKFEANSGWVGTPAYMSPEQARGESHLVDGRSDIFSLGVVLYQMLTGKRPFSGCDRDSIMESLVNQEVRPVRQIQSSLPRELERICMKMLAKRASMRYSTAGDLVQDIEHFLGSYGSEFDAPASDDPGKPTPTPTMGVIPRGLRSYGRHDAEFFCRLLPGPHDREWVPESLRFWKRQIESSDDPPRVGILYGPSGCGKSSFVKAGLLPLLDNSISTVFVEATREETESRLIRSVRKEFGGVKANWGLVETLTHIRRKNETSSAKLLIVIDQFEQWLHGRTDSGDPELATALRQCDGHAVQCLLLVRDDFWLALSRFMTILELPIEQNRNAALVDLFSPSHARRVLTEFGIAYGRLPHNAAEFSSEQTGFLDSAIGGLAESGKVFPVRLALFVEMLKNQQWELETLSSVGGVEGLGMRFLNESFSSNLAPAAQRTHEPAVRKTLRELLPETGVNIKGVMQSEQDLLEASGYSDQPAQFKAMIRILDTDLRLVTPTDPAGTQTGDESASQSGDGVRYYQLTHDYLVPAIEQWLTQKQRETRQGRAELRLSEYASVWSAKPQAKYTPSWLDWLTILAFSSRKRWSTVERNMMRMASRRHWIRTICVFALMATMAATGWYIKRKSDANTVVQQLQTARTSDMSTILESIKQEGRFALAPLRDRLSKSEGSSRNHLVNQLALMQSDPEYRTSLARRSVDVDMPMVAVLRDELQPFDEASRSFLVGVLDDSGDSRQRLRAAVMLAGDPATQGNASLWNANSKLIADDILQHVKVSPQDSGLILDGLTPVSEHLIAPLRSECVAPKETAKRSLATSFLVRFLREDSAQLLDLFLSVSLRQQPVILPTLDPLLQEAAPLIRQRAFATIDDKLSEEEYNVLARQKGVAGGLLHRMGEADSTWPLLDHSAWPHARSYLIYSIAQLSTDFDALLNRFSRETRVPLRRGMLQAMGRFQFDAIAEDKRLPAFVAVMDAMKNDADPGIHSAAEWVLRRWGRGADVVEFLEQQRHLKPDPRKNWYVNAQGQTMAIFDAREDPAIGRVFAISTKEVTVEQFKRFSPDHSYYEFRSPTEDCPVGLLDWLDAIKYCSWLNDELRIDAKHSYTLDFPDDFDDMPAIVNDGGYRLPTIAEWQYACAAMTTSVRYYGSGIDLADEYFWTYESSALPDERTRYNPGGSRPPNDFGMFAMYDGVREWGHTSSGGDRRHVMGSSSSEVANARVTQQRSADLPRSRNGFYGVRVARTIVAD